MSQDGLYYGTGINSRNLCTNPHGRGAIGWS